MDKLPISSAEAKMRNFPSFNSKSTDTLRVPVDRLKKKKKKTHVSQTWDADNSQFDSERKYSFSLF